MNDPDRPDHAAVDPDEEPIPPAPAPDPNPAVEPEPAKEPLLTVGAITAVTSAAVSCVVAFGVHLTETQQGAILALIATVAPIVVALFARRSVYSPMTVARLLEGQRNRR